MSFYYLLILRVLIVGIIIVTVFFFLHKRNHEEKKIKERGFSKEYRIKYDKKDRRAYFIIGIVSFLTIILLSVLSDVDNFGSFGAISYLIALASGLLLIGTVFKYIDCCDYLKKLDRNGYLIPLDKKEYGYSLEELKRISDEERQNNEKSVLEATADSKKRDSRSIIFCVASIVIYIFSLIYSVDFLTSKYPLYGEPAKNAFVFMLVFDCIWLIFAIKYYIQSNNEKYKDITDICEGKKSRPTLVNSIVALILVMGFLFMIKANFSSLAHFISKNMISVNAMYCDEIQLSFKACNEEGIIPDEVLKELKGGVDITNWEADCDFKRTILKREGCDSFAELRDKVRNPNGVPQIIVIYDGEKFIVTIENVFTPV